MKMMQKEHIILHEKFVMCGANAKKWMRDCILLLPEIEKERIWEKKGFESIYVYAAKLGGMSHATVDDALRILLKIEGKPALKKVVAEKGINAVRPVIAIATAEKQEMWAEKAATMSKNTLEVYVKEFRRTSTEENAHQQAILQNVPMQATVTMQLDSQIADQLQKLKGNADWNDLMKQFLETHQSLLDMQKPEAVETDSRPIPAKIIHHIEARSNGICEYPHCQKPYEILHHTQRWGLEHIHDPDRIVGLCEAHERLAHYGLIENEELAP